MRPYNPRARQQAPRVQHAAAHVPAPGRHRRAQGKGFKVILGAVGGQGALDFGGGMAMGPFFWGPGKPEGSPQTGILIDGVTGFGAICIRACPIFFFSI